MTLLTRRALVAALVTSAGCAMGAPTASDNASGGTAPVSLNQRLNKPIPLTIASDSDVSDAQLDAVALGDGSTAHVQIGVTDGAITLDRTAPDGTLLIKDLAIDVDDVNVSPSILPPSGLHVTDISAVLDRPASATVTHESDDHIEASATVSIAIEWSAVMEHGVVDLAPIHLTDLPVTFDIDQTAGGELVANLHAEQSGSFWTWADTFELCNLSLDLAADAP